MSREKNEKWLDELISRTINSGKPEFEAEKWKQKYPEELQMLRSMSEKDSHKRQPNIWRMVLRSPITKLAAAAVIIVGIGLFSIFVHQGPSEQHVPKVVESPTKMMTAMSLTMAYRDGGIKAMEEQFEKALEMLGPRPANITVKELLAGFNGT